MKVAFLQPEVPMARFIRAIWHFESEHGLPPAEQNIAAPNGCPKLIVLLENSLISTVEGIRHFSPEGGIYFVGNRDTAVSLQTSEKKTAFVVIEFFPHGAFPIFGGLEGVEEMLPRWSLEILHGASVEGGVKRLQEGMGHLLRRNRLQSPTLDYCVSELERTHGRVLIEDLAQRTGYSRRHLETLFKTQIGLTPKGLSGIIRFQKFHRKLAEGQSLEIIKSELYDEYYDQSHFTREFKRLTGHAPGKYLRFSNEYGRRISAR